MFLGGGECGAEHIIESLSHSYLPYGIHIPRSPRYKNVEAKNDGQPWLEWQVGGGGSGNQSIKKSYKT